MKSIKQIAVLVLLCIVFGCGPTNNGPSPGNSTPKDATVELKTGGIYAAANEKGKYTLTKILALDDSTMHCRFFNEEFDELPTNVSSADLTFLIGHAPLARDGFLSEHRDLVTVEAVADSELAGYRMYLEAMSGN